MMNSPVPKSVPKPEKNEAWMSLCSDPRWKFQPSIGAGEEGSEGGESSLFFAEGWDKPESSTDNRIRIVPSEEEDMIHRGALAPRFVFEARAKNEPRDDDMKVYIRRLICVLCKRFVIISRPSADGGESLAETEGMPRDGTRYWWRYWDNEGNVYQVTMEKFRNSAGTLSRNYGLDCGFSQNYRDLKEATSCDGMPPGDFEPMAGLAWMRVSASLNSTGNECTDLSGFLDHAWAFAHHGTTRVPLWDASLKILSGLAGVPDEKYCHHCTNPVEHVLRRCSRCKLVYYCNMDGSFCQREDWPDHKKMCKYFPKSL